MTKKYKNKLEQLLYLKYKYMLTDKELAGELKINFATLRKYKNEKQIPNKKSFHIKHIETIIDTYTHKCTYNKKASTNKELLILLLKKYNRMFIDNKELSKLIGVSQTTIDKRIRKKTNIPHFIKFRGSKGTLRFCIIHVAEYLVSINKDNSILNAYSKNISVALDTIRFNVNGDYVNEILELFKGHGFDTKEFIISKNYTFKEFIFRGFRVYYVTLHNLTIVEFFGLKSYKEEEELKQKLKNFYTFIKDNRLVSQTYISRIDVAVDLEECYKNIELYSTSTKIKSNINSQTSSYKDYTFYLKQLNYSADLNNIQAEQIKKYNKVGIKIKEKNNIVSGNNDELDEIFEELGIITNTHKCIVSEEYYKDNFIFFKKLEEYGINFSQKKNVNQVLLYDKAKKERLDYTLSRIEFKILFPAQEQICLADIFNKNYDGLVSNIYKEISKYIVIVEENISNNYKATKIEFNNTFLQLLEQDIAKNIKVQTSLPSGHPITFKKDTVSLFT